MGTESGYAGSDASGEVRKWLCLPVILTGPFLSLFDQFCVNLAAPSIRSSFDLSPFLFQAVVGGYGLTFGLLLMTGGQLGDGYGKKRLYQIGLIAFAGTSLLCGVSWNGLVLVIARLLQGASAALLQPQVLALVRVQFSEHERPRALSWYGVSMSLGMVFGQILGGALPSVNILGVGWRAVFFIAIPIAVSSGIFCNYLIDDDTQHGTADREKVDLLGTGWLGTSLALVLSALSLIRRVNTFTVFIPLIVSGLLFLAGFIYFEFKRSRKFHPTLVPLSLFRNRYFTLGICANFTLYVASVPFFVLLGLYFQNGRGMPPSVSGICFVPVAISIAIGSRLGLPISRRLGQSVTLILAGFFTLVGLTVALIVLLQEQRSRSHVSIIWIIVGIAIFGLGNGTSIPLITGIVLGRIPATMAGIGSAVLTSAQQIAAACGVAIMGVALFENVGDVLHYASGMSVLCVFAIFSLICIVALTRISGTATAR
ncbi:MAG: MFS transporter [Gordonia sp. (in: high G+C Gram-positive bacteria)]